MFKGLRTVIYKVSDIDAAKKWYSAAFSTEPYFDEPFYVGFNIGGFELGLDPDTESVSIGNNAVAYWGVDEAETAFQKLISAGATQAEAVHDVGGGIKVATVIDPFGNTIGIIENPHFQAES
jgi:predicted enzyme related to lactoylglutathione lyase